GVIAWYQPSREITRMSSAGRPEPTGARNASAMRSASSTPKTIHAEDLAILRVHHGVSGIDGLVAELEPTARLHLALDLDRGRRRRLRHIDLHLDVGAGVHRAASGGLGT